MENITATPTRNTSKIAVIIRDNVGSFIPEGVLFDGELIAHASSLAVSEMVGKALGSCKEARWQELNLYRTKSGKFVCQRIYRTQRQGEQDVHEGEVCEDRSEVIKFFGDGWLAKELFEDAGIDASIDVNKGGAL
ncbi:hypothetical protein [Nitrosomonas sp. Is37]|uniref:hypothetical protein n=1 Tax=Nitrosomonas sp. Is37 TaxID=3080535 RepID=UPI00294AC5E6|nr:hypothetical protein [Nitrosomonas sp. Is37]MDV6345398.1 hypothetical protein [Nitrosomonas sp. Is37]